MSPESMFPESAPLPGSPAPGQPPAVPSRIRAIFLGTDGIRPGWRVLIFVVLFSVLVSLALSGLIHIPAFGKLRKAAVAGTLTPGYLIVFESVEFGMAVLAALVMTWIEKQKFGTYGIPLRGAFGKNFWSGIFWGLAFMTLELSIMRAMGGFTFGGLALSGAAIAKYAAMWAVGFVLVGFAEEFVFRGYAQYTLSKGIGFWPAAILLSSAFGGLHLFNSGEDWVGAASVFVFGMFACFTLWRTGSLWFAIGFHAAGDYSESFLYSVPDSGTLATGHLLRSSFHGPAWLTGGTVGPEGSALNFAVFALALVLFAWLFPGKKNELQS
ncbi:MAG TPA: type II CAAX endopeptidase family protein [Candidatus Dormibacteraeota bacterium]|nr:type II CAAX endopeptidase family protein [Candidatus Dormibacteraeota bacterium]